MSDTKVRILDTAERLFARDGFEVSLRTITAEAGVNLAAVNYHFQSKEALLDAVVARRLGPVNQRRIEMLDRLEVEAGDGRLPLEGVLEAFFAPVFEVGGPNGCENFRPLMGRLYSLPQEFIKHVYRHNLEGIVQRFDTALSRAMPELPAPERLWRLYFAVGVMVHTINWSQLIPALSDGRLDASDSPMLLRRMITFVAAGFRERSAMAGEGRVQ
jgi:AcrR family transcriptional regulator